MPPNSDQEPEPSIWQSAWDAGWATARGNAASGMVIRTIEGVADSWGEYTKVYDNYREIGSSHASSLSMTVYFGIADQVGVRNLADGAVGTDSVDNRTLSGTEKATRLITGSIQIIGSALGMKAVGSNSINSAKAWLHCFPAGTPVHTETGIRPIETVAAGDNVWSFNHASGKWQLQQVLNTIARPLEEPFVTVQIAGEEIEATGGHPYWVVDGEDLADRPTYDELVPTTPEDSTLPGRWVMAIDLRVGDILWQRDGGQVAVEEISVEFKEKTIYNFEVASQHNYAVGQRGFLVHNTNQRWERMKATVTGWTKSFGDNWSGIFNKKYRGGSYGQLKAKQYRNKGLEAHHLPANSVNGIPSTSRGPAIHMDRHDHTKTSSHGNRPGHNEYLAEIDDLILEGKTREAMAREILDVRRAAKEGSGNASKYNQALLEMLEYARNIGYINKG